MHKVRLPLAILSIVAAVVVLLTGFWNEVATSIFPDSTWGLYSREFFENVLVEAHGTLLDLLVVGVVLFWFERRRERAESIEEQKTTLADLRYYRGNDASYRVFGTVKRLQSYGISALPLAEAMLNDLEITEIQFYESDLRATNFANSKLKACTFENCRAEAAIFVGARFNHITLKNVSLRRAKFNNAVLKGIDFSECQIEGVDFTNADLSSAIFRGVDCKNVKFQNANLRSANFKGALNLTQAMLNSASNTQYIKR